MNNIENGRGPTEDWGLSSYRLGQETCRTRYLETYDEQGAAQYDSWVATMTEEDHAACLRDLVPLLPAQQDSPARVLDAGAGSGALCLALTQVPDFELTALEPAPAMLELLRARPELQNVKTVKGFCDHEDDRSLFPPCHFDLIASRQLANCLFDPLAAFRNWFEWLTPGGSVAVMDGFYDSAGWGEQWEVLGRHLPLSCCTTPATVAYLLEQCGFQVQAAEHMHKTNALASTRTPRYIVIASKPVQVQ